MNIKTGLEYFSFDIDFFQNVKIQFIFARFGLKGEAITIRLLCEIYRKGYYLDWNDDIALLFAKSVGDGCQHSCVKDVVFELLKRGFFDKSIFERFSILTSVGIQKRYFEVTKRRKDVEYNPDFILIDMSYYSNVTAIRQNVNILGENVNILGENADILKQSKVKESKVKESKKDVVNARAHEDKKIFQEVVLSMQQIKPSMNSVDRDFIVDMLDNYPKDWILGAVKVALDKKTKVYSLNFIDKILANWREAGFEDTAKPWEGINSVKYRKRRFSGSNRETADAYATKPSQVDWANEPDHL